MIIEHLAIWARDIEKLREFYTRYLGAVSGERYYNASKNFQSYFLAFGSGCRLELMQMPGIPDSLNDPDKQFIGLVHFAIRVGSKQKVDDLTSILRQAGFRIVGEPRTTGDGYYESVVLDPEGNRIELVA